MKNIWKPDFSRHFVETKSKQMLKPFAHPVFSVFQHS